MFARVGTTLSMLLVILGLNSVQANSVAHPQLNETQNTFQSPDVGRIYLTLTGTYSDTDDDVDDELSLSSKYFPDQSVQTLKFSSEAMRPFLIEMEGLPSDSFITQIEKPPKL
jgi:hypothetical protein